MAFMQLDRLFITKHSPPFGRLFGAGILGLCLTMVMMACGKPPEPPSVEAVLRQSWQYYQQQFMVNGERVQSNTYQGTISEGQSYALLKAVWMNDPEVFEKTWQWTQRELDRPKDHLFGWRWGERPDHTWGLLFEESAPDADQDIAYALLLAGEQWNRPDYIQSARAIIADFWRVHVVRLGGRYYLTAGDWEGFRQPYLTLNPSYFAPYVYRHFARYDEDPAHAWAKLAQDSYATLEACSNLTQHKLPPNWCSVDWKTHRIGFSDVQGENARDFSYDAIRVFWRMAMDAADTSADARGYLSRHHFLMTLNQGPHQFPPGFGPNGESRGTGPSGFTLSPAMAQYALLHPGDPDTLYQKTLAPYYHPRGFWFNDYDDFLHSVIWLHLYTLTLNSPGPSDTSRHH